MKVVLLKPVRKLGKIGEIVEVKPGFGRNFLIPQSFAVRATESNQKMIEEQKKDLEAKNAEAKKQAEALSAKIVGKDFTFICQSAADGRLFGSVSNKEIAKIVAASGYEISHSAIHLDKPIKNLGIHEVSIVLHSDVITKIIVNVARSESEAIESLKEFKNPTVKDEVIEEVSYQTDNSSFDVSAVE